MLKRPATPNSMGKELEPEPHKRENTNGQKSMRRYTIS